MIIKQLTVGEMPTFCYVLGCERTRAGVVIDPGGDAERILAVIREQALQIRYIINTHCHPDHTCGNGKIKESTGAEIVLHQLDHDLLRDPAAAAYFKRMGLPPSPPADRLVADGDFIRFGKYSLKVINTPGHSPGGICLYGAGQLFTGDSLFVGAAGRVDMPGGDFNTLLKGLEEKIAPLPEETVIWPGHDYGETPTSTIGREKKENPFLGGEW